MNETPRNEESEATRELPPEQPGPRKLLRSRSDRVVGGVCGGLGRHFGTDPVLFRVAAIVLTFIGGTGLLLYLALLLLVPSEPVAGAPAAAPAGAPPSGEQRSRWLVIGGAIVVLGVTWPLILGGGLLLGAILVPLAVLAVLGVGTWWLVTGEGPTGDAGDIARRAALGFGVLVLCWLLAVAGAWATAAGGDAVVAAIVIGAGIAILAGAFVRPVRWLILPAVVLALSAGTVAAAGIELDGGVGERDYRPASAADLRERYELGMGKLQIDLRDTDLPPGDTPLTIDLGVGEARLIVPDDVCVATRADIGAGEIQHFDRTNGGVDLDWNELPSAPAGSSRLVVDADIGMGALDIDDAPDDVTFRGSFDERDSELEDNPRDRPGNRACDG